MNVQLYASYDESVFRKGGVLRGRGGVVHGRRFGSDDARVSPAVSEVGSEGSLSSFPHHRLTSGIRSSTFPLYLSPGFFPTA